MTQSLEARNKEKVPGTCEAAATKATDCQIQKLQKTVTRLSDIELEISETKEEMTALLKDMKDMKCCTKYDEDFRENLEWLKNYKEEMTGQNFRGPSFISDWFPMKSQDAKLSHAEVEHGLGVIPYKVDVLIKPTDGPNAGWIFHGDSAFQTDDDIGHIYGGVVYLYNETHVRLFAPKRGNDKYGGRIINTGAEGGLRLGSNHQTSDSALVLVKVWGPDDMALPDYESDWLPIDIADNSTSFYEVKHGFGGYPAVVTVQVHNVQSSYISDGVGSTVSLRNWLNGGGVAWAFNDYSVRIWSAYVPNHKDDKMQYYGKPISGNDGWGISYIFSEFDMNKADVRVRAWSPNTLKSKQNFFQGRANIEENEFGPVSTQYTPSDKDLFSFFTEATSGPNDGYRFIGYGGAHGEKNSFGGSVFAYNESGYVRAWPPNVSKKGHYVFIGDPYGNGNYTQSSNEAVFVPTLLKSYP